MGENGRVEGVVVVVVVRDMEKGSARAQNRVIGYLNAPLWLPEEI